MPRVTCRCGERLKVPADGPDRVDCPLCGAHIRLRQPEAGPKTAVDSTPPPPNDGFIRFPCPCGRRLKVRAEDGVDAGRCPDCGRVVPVPVSVAVPKAASPSASSQSAPSRPTRVSEDSRTDELDADDLARLERWSSKFKPLPGAVANSSAPGQPTPPHMAAAPAYAPITPPNAPVASIVKFEAGMRICPRCGKPVHLGAITCRDCGASVPRR